MPMFLLSKGYSNWTYQSSFVVTFKSLIWKAAVKHIFRRLHFQSSAGGTCVRASLRFSCRHGYVRVHGDVTAEDQGWCKPKFRRREDEKFRALTEKWLKRHRICILLYWCSDWPRAGRPRVRSSSPGRVKNFHFSISSRPALGSTQRPIQWVLGVKRPGREADHSPPTSAEVKKMWIYTSTPPYVFMA
jgi:hypothetical protein